ncbi:hypothetical protein CLOM_g8702, partial [Closterium sp. NIES-68]
LVRTGPAEGAGSSPGAEDHLVARKAGPALAKIQCRAPIIRGVERATGNRCRLASSATPRPPWRAMGRWRASWAGGEPGRRRNSEASFLTGLSVDLGLEGGMEHTRLVRVSLSSRRGQAAAARGTIGGMACTLGANPSHPAWGTRE